MEFKRNHWTNEEVIEFLDGQKFVPNTPDEPLDEFARNYNDGIDAAKSLFYSFQQPIDSFGALGYDEKTKTTYHIGPRLPR